MASRFGCNKDTERLIRRARHEGWTVEMTRNNHLKFVPPTKDQQIIHAGLTMSTSGVVQLRNRLRRAGVTV